MSKDKKTFKHHDLLIENERYEIIEDEGWGESKFFSKKDWDAKVVLTRKKSEPTPEPEFVPGYFYYALTEEEPLERPTLHWFNVQPSGIAVAGVSMKGCWVRWVPSAPDEEV